MVNRVFTNKVHENSLAEHHMLAALYEVVVVMSMVEITDESLKKCRCERNGAGGINHEIS